MALEQYLGNWSVQIKELRNSVSSVNWSDFDRPVFVDAVEKGISELEQIKGALEKIQEDIEKQPLQNAPDCSEVKNEFSRTIELLKKNLALEQNKKSRAKEINMWQTDSQPELYSSLQQKILSLLLKTSYLNERLQIFSKKQTGMPLPAKSTGKQLMELLERKEQELQEMQGKYSAMRKKAYLGLMEEKQSADLEADISGLEKGFSGNYAAIEQKLQNAAVQVESMQAVFADAKEKIAKIREILDNYSEKNIELVKALKKERDYAKKTVLDIENETMHLRSAYTQEMLGLQETKLAAKQEGEARHAKTVSSLQKQLEEKEDSLKRFKKIAEDKLQKEQHLEEKIKQLQLLLKAKEKHDSVKRNFKKKTAKRN